MYEEYKVFPKSEFENRWRRAHQLMDKRGIDVLFVTGDTDFVYFTGAENTFCYTRPLIVIIPRDRDPLILAPEAYLEGVMRTGWVDDCRGHRILGAPIQMVVKTLEELGVDGGTIGCELGQNTRLGITMGEFLEIQRRLPAAKFVDASDLLATLREVKSELELDAHRRACWITSKMLERVPDLVREGMTEAEAARVLMSYMVQEGGFTPFVYVKSGPEATLPAGSNGRFPVRNTTRTLKSGYLLIDAGTCFNGYWSDFGRHYWVGTPPKEAIRYWEIDREMLETAIRMIKPGVRPRALLKASIKVLSKSGEVGISVNSTGRIGHGLGLDHCERPDISKEYPHNLRVGNFFALEPHCRTKLGWFVLEQNIAVTPHGYDVYSRAPLDVLSI